MIISKIHNNTHNHKQTGYSFSRSKISNFSRKGNYCPKTSFSTFFDGGFLYFHLFDIYRQKHISVLIYLPFFVVVLVLILITWTCNMRLSGLIQCQCVIISHILLLYFILSETIHKVSTPANNNGPTPYQLFPMMMMSSLFRLFLRTPFSNFFLFSLPL